MRGSLIISLIIGGLVSGGLLLGDQLSGSELAWMDWEMPGIVATYLFWGSVVVGVIICWFVNAIVDSVPVLTVLIIVKLTTKSSSQN